MNDKLPIRDRTLILRVLVPGLEAQLRYKMQETADGCTKDSVLDLDGVTCEPTAARNNTLWSFHCDGATYPAKLVNLPCPIEIHKTHDHAAYYKCVDVAQMLIVYEDDMALEEADEKPTDGFPSYYHSGLTAPMHNVVENRFKQREHKAVAPPRQAVLDVEADMIKLMDKIAQNEKSSTAAKRKVPTLTTANKVLVEVEEEVVYYEPWMENEQGGVEFEALEAEDTLCDQHPEIWLKPETLQQIRDDEEAAIRKKEEAAAKKEARKKQKEEKKAEERAEAEQAAAVPQDDDQVAEVARMLMESGDGLDLEDGFDLDLDDFENDTLDLGLT